MASSSAFNRVELSAVSSIPLEHVEFNWTIKHFPALYQSAIDRNDVVIASLPFDLRPTLFPPGTPQVSMYWELQVEDKDYAEVGLRLRRKTLDKEGSLPVLPRTLFSESSASIYGDFKRPDSKMMEKRKWKLQNHSTSPDLYGPLTFCINKVWNSEGSLHLKVSTKFYVDSDGIAEILQQQEQENIPAKEESYKLSKQILLDQVASLLGDEGTSDVIVSVRNNNVETDSLVEFGSFFCHSAIVSSRSVVLREKLKDSKEKKDGKILLKLQEDVALEVIDYFLTFIYSGRLKDNRKDRHSAVPSWIASLPELFQLAVKYEVEDLVDFCDLNLHQAALVSPAKAAEILSLAKRWNLKRTLDKLQTAFSKDPELLFQSLNL